MQNLLCIKCLMCNLSESMWTDIIKFQALLATSVVVDGLDCCSFPTGFVSWDAHKLFCHWNCIIRLTSRFIYWRSTTFPLEFISSFVNCCAQDRNSNGNKWTKVSQAHGKIFQLLQQERITTKGETENKTFLLLLDSYFFRSNIY